MATDIQVTKRLCLPALVEIEDPIFKRFYGYGVYWNLYESETPGPLEDMYLPNMLKSYMQCHSPEDPHERSIVWHAAFSLGMVHGGVLRRRDGMLRPDVANLVTLTDLECSSGYAAGREFYFLEAVNEQERLLTDTKVVEQLCELVRESPEYGGNDPDGVLRFALGGIAGVLSGQLFPWTRAEQEVWEEESISSIGYVCAIPQTCLAARLFVPAAS